jgi:hypothetical protein
VPIWIIPLICLAAIAQAAAPEGHPGGTSVRAIPFLTLPEPPQAPPGLISLQPIPDGSGRLVVSDGHGRLLLTDTTGRTPVLFLDLAKYGGFGFLPDSPGLTGVAFHPDFGNPSRAGHGRFYTAYTARADTGRANYLDDAGDGVESVIREWTMQDPEANRFSGSSRELFRMGRLGADHVLGAIAFDPDARPGDENYGLLYAGVGGGDTTAATGAPDDSFAVPVGAILRIDPLGGGRRQPYAIPAGNPHAGQPGAAEEIWVSGLGDPLQFSWDPRTRRMLIADAARNRIDEVRAGERDTHLFALLEDGTVGGGFVYRGTDLPAMQARYLFTDPDRGRLLCLEPDDPAPRPDTVRILSAAGDEASPIESAGLQLGRDDAGELYVLSTATGRIYRLSSSVPSAP